MCNLQDAYNCKIDHLKNISAEQLIIILHAVNTYGDGSWSYTSVVNDLRGKGLNINIYQQLSFARINQLIDLNLIKTIKDPSNDKSILCILTDQGRTCVNCLSNTLHKYSHQERTISFNCSVCFRKIPARLLIVLLYAYINYRDDPWSYNSVVKELQLDGVGVDIYPQMLSSHINTLKEMGLIETMKHGRSVVCIWTEKSNSCCLANLAGAFSMATSNRAPIASIMGCGLWR